MNGYLLALLIFIIYLLLILTLWRRGLLKRMNASLVGPLLMIRTQRGKGFIERLSRYKRFWKAYGTIGIVICILIMFLMYIGLILGLLIVVTTGGGDPIPPEKMLVIPGINPIVPLWYGIFALFIAIIVHEFSHGILARIAKVKIRSLGALLCVVPIGAFVEPDDEELKAVGRGKRARVFAAGPMSNIVLGLLCAAIFSWSFMGSVVPVAGGAMVMHIVEDGPADAAGFERFDQVIEIDGTPILNVSDFTSYNLYEANDTIPEIIVLRGGEEHPIRDVKAGLFISSVTPDLPASEAGLDTGMILGSIDGVPMRSNKEFSDFMGETTDGQVISVVAYVPIDILGTENDSEDGVEDEPKRTYVPHLFDNITLADKYDFYKDVRTFSQEDRDTVDAMKGVGFLGVTTQFLGLVTDDPQDIIDSLAYPVQSADSRNEARNNLLKYTFTYPWDGKILPLHEPLTEQYEVEGFWSFLPMPAFWALANVFYYLFWINFLLGTFNALPAVPFDGGYIFKDTLGSFLSRVKKKASREVIDRQVRSVTFFISLTVLISIMGVLILPFIR